MFENMNPMDRSTAFFEIAILLLISFIIGFVAARIPIPGNASSKNNRKNKKSANVIDDEVDPRDIITEPITIKAVLTRDRKGNPIAPINRVKKKPTTNPPNSPPATKIAAIKKDYSKNTKGYKTTQTETTPSKTIKTKGNPLKE